MTLKTPSLLIIALLILLLPSTPLLSETPTKHSHTVIVSIAPYKSFVEAIAGDTVKVILMVPTGGSPHSYEPTAKQVLAAGKGDAWFRIGEPFETRALQALKSYNPTLASIDMREGADLIYVGKGEHHCPHHSCVDPHIWLSPKMTKKQAEIIANTLTLLYPENTGRYQTALRKFQNKLDNLDLEITNTLRPLNDRTLLVSHPAYAYFCRDYNLKQLSIEFEGKEPSPKQLTEILNQARAVGSRVVFAQAQHLSKGARLVAKELGARVVEIDPLSEDYFENMLKMARSFAVQ